MPLMSTFGAFNPLNKGEAAQTLSQYYARYLVVASPQYYMTSLDDTYGDNDRTVAVDSTGVTYILSWDIASTARVLNISRFNADRTVSVIKSITFTVGTLIQSVNILIDNDIPYVAVNVSYSGGTQQLSLMQFDNNLNIVWQKAYSRSDVNGYKIYMAKNPSQPYIYITQGLNTVYIFNTSGVLLNAYNGVTLNLPLHPNTSFQNGAGPFFVNGTKLCGGKSIVTLGAGLTTITSATTYTVTTPNVVLQNSTYNRTDGYIYGAYYNTATTLSGLYKYSFTTGLVSKYEFTFSEPGPIRFMGMTNDGTYIYVTGRNSTGTLSYMLKFDTGMNYIGGYKFTISGSIAADPSFIPSYFDNKTYAVSINALWVLPSDLSTPGTGTYSVNSGTYVKSTIVSPTRTTGTLAFSSAAGTITTVTPALLTQTLVPVSATNQTIFVGL